MEKVRIGIIGTGNIAMYWAHWPEYQNVKNCEITAVCDIDETKLNTAGDMLGIPAERRFTDYRDLIACDQVDAVDIATWNSVHCEIAEAAVLAGKPYSIEKPVGMNYGEVQKLADLTHEHNIPSFVCLSWRYRPYTRMLQTLITEGKVGKMYHVYIRCIKDSGLWPGRKREWRFDNARAGSGVLGDLGSHMIDMVRFWGEEFKEVYAKTGIFIHERQEEDSDAFGPVDTDDWCNVNAVLENGVGCTIELSRVATTLGALISFEIYGEKGRLEFFCGDETYLKFTDAQTKETEMITPPDDYCRTQSQTFTDMTAGIDDPFISDIDDGLACQAVIDAMVISAKENRPVTIAEIKNGVK